MPLNIDSALGPLPQALKLRARRTEILASNIANADTPNYKARDFDFRAAMSAAASDQLSLRVTQPGHISSNAAPGTGIPLQYRVPSQPSLDGNTVDAQAEQAAFSENAVMYQTTLTFLSGRIKGLKMAIKGE
ncbi:flagellar basal body rod protein FlgB [Thiohalobacter sp. IOR34]|uniref:flagellar basal body rod protein FlgB n=1 Tax=Thiohalobacter sp. IOR34 TaxID=3057176 RepID=UPI0025B0C856|nr:flagellar basal body rod protein FlgB [Thiohalobacter sp. IOR34]WJW74614.1 flagellar basal body rod protein FlgB [Thiohalobacter sp. IOR34]